MKDHVTSMEDQVISMEVNMNIMASNNLNQ